MLGYENRDTMWRHQQNGTEEERRQSLRVYGLSCQDEELEHYCMSKLELGKFPK